MKILSYVTQDFAKTVCAKKASADAVCRAILCQRDREVRHKMAHAFTLHELLEPPPSPSLARGRNASVLCFTGVVTLNLPIKHQHLARVLDISSLRRADKPHQWHVYRRRADKKIVAGPVTADATPMTVRTAGLTLMYTTAGCYHTDTEAKEEYTRLPKFKKGSPIVLVDEEEEAKKQQEKAKEEAEVSDDPESDDTEFDDDGEPIPKKKKPKPRKGAAKARKYKKPEPENLIYRDAIVERQRQAAGTIDYYSALHFGLLVQPVISTLLQSVARSLAEDGKLKRNDFGATLYTADYWLVDFEREAKAAGCTRMAECARGLLETHTVV